jgi:hypothetical protein
MRSWRASIIVPASGSPQPEFEALAGGGFQPIQEKSVAPVCAVLLAEACNIGLEPLVREDNPALTRNRLSGVQQNYIRADTLAQANAGLVEGQTANPLAQQWGGGEVASVDGMRFVTPVRTINAGPNRKYFGAERGITYYNFTSDQYAGLHAVARKICYGQHGEIRKRYREGQEDQLSALGLVVNAVILWNTIYTAAALEQLRAAGYAIRPEDVARLSPLPTHHINVLGRYAFLLAEQVARGGMRPLRGPEDDDWSLA